ncbi:MAG: TetR/AcrR family transcriptional regulator [Spirochaetes bacterium]|nr:TetR/AcrR family transcriptional regulator [Spirochaetota bacterium]
MTTKTQTGNIRDKKGIRTRETITRAARKVFSEYPYHTASMRMIGKEAGIEHPLINYYFPSKARLFETVTSEICSEFIRRNEEWFDEIRNLKITDALTSYIDRLLDYNAENPEPLRLLALNITQAEHITQIPGYQQFPDLIEKIQQLFMKIIPIKSTAQQVSIYINSFVFLAIALLGSSPCVAQVQGMEPGSAQFREWLRSALNMIFLPPLKDIINIQVNTVRGQKKKSE